MIPHPPSSAACVSFHEKVFEAKALNFHLLIQAMHAQWLRSCPTLFDSVDHSLPGSSVHRILQATVLEWVADPPPGGLPDSGIEPMSLTSPALQVVLYRWATGEALIQVIDTPQTNFWEFVSCKELVLLFFRSKIKATWLFPVKENKVTHSKNMRQLSVGFISFHMVIPAV